VDRDVLLHQMTDRFQELYNQALDALDRAPDGQWIAASERVFLDVFRQRMKERSFDIQDALRVLENATNARPKWNTKSSTWNYDLSGTDIDGEDLTIRIAITEDDNGVVLVTGF